MILSAKQISKSYASTAVLHPMDLAVDAGEKLGIIGETGSGKTTLLRALCGLLDVTDGEIRFQSERVAGPAEKLIPGHPQIAYLSQSVDLRNQYRVRDLLELNSIQELEADEALATLCRIDHLMDRMTDQLSGGERQRIGLAIALAKKPTILMLDEPFSNLDIGHRNTLRSILDELHQTLGLTLLIVSHNPGEVLGWADRILVLRAGYCIQTGTPENIYNEPANEYVAQLLGAFNPITPNRSEPFQILRPERLKLTATGNGIRSGIIMKKEFEGATTLYSIQNEEGLWWVRIADSELPIGREVGFIHA